MSKTPLLISSLFLASFGCTRIYFQEKTEDTSSSDTSDSGSSRNSESTDDSLITSSGDVTSDAEETTSFSTLPDVTASNTTDDTTTPTLDLPPSLCQNGTVDPGEECDDGDDNDANTCANNCTSNCQNGILNDGEQCDDGNSIDSDECTSKCMNATCGDGLLRSNVERCDDGNQKDDDACNKDCEKNGRLVFISSRTFTGDFELADDSLFPNGEDGSDKSGLADADMQCWDMARQAMESGDLAWAIPAAEETDRRFMAWMSRSNVDKGGLKNGAWPTNYENGFPSCGTETPFFLPTGERVADSMSDLTSFLLILGAGPELQINIDELGRSHNQSEVWTNTMDNGFLKSIHADCDEWTSSRDSTGWVGQVHIEDVNGPHKRWTDHIGAPCSSNLRIYCFEQCPKETP